jgi:hypothetical protein
VRCALIEPNGGWSADAVNGYGDAFRTYRNHNVPVFAILPPTFAFLLPGTILPPASDPDYASAVWRMRNLPEPGPSVERPGLTNPYITYFSGVAGAICSQVFTASDGWVQDFIIWNEPNNASATTLTAEVFGALMYQCRRTIASNLRLYWGGIVTVPNTGGSQIVGEEDGYVSRVYDAVVGQPVVGDPSGSIGEMGPWPWSGINIHVHRRREPEDFRRLSAALRGEIDRRGEHEVISGEWGVTEAEERDNPGNMASLFRTIVPVFNRMFYFNHPRHFEEDTGENWVLVDIGGRPGVGRALFTLSETAMYRTLGSVLGSLPTP